MRDSEQPHSASRELLRAWFDDHLVDDVVLHDITTQAATSLSGILVQRQLSAPDEREAAHWAARARIVKRQVASLDPDDRAGLIAQQQAWLDEARALTEFATPQPA